MTDALETWRLYLEGYDFTVVTEITTCAFAHYHTNSQICFGFDKMLLGMRNSCVSRSTSFLKLYSNLLDM